MSDIDLSDIYALGKRLAQARRKAIEDFETYDAEAANGEHEYHKVKAVAFARSRGQGEGSGAAEIYANGESADARRRRDLAEGKKKAAQLRIEEIERNQASVNKEIDVALKLGYVPEPEATHTFGAKAA